MRTRGAWPGAVQLRRGWARARARPWNDQTTTSAALRLERGGDRFLADCARWLTSRGVDEVLSPALTAGGPSGVWQKAGFVEHLSLVVYERSLLTEAAEPSHDVQEARDPDVEKMTRLDDRAFVPRWRVGRLGLVDAMSATSSSRVFVVSHQGTMRGFLIAGESGDVGYIQRVAVEPDHGGRGLGRSLVRESIRWARRAGARSMLLNTQPENRPAAALYLSEGFTVVGGGLSVLRWNRPVEEEVPA